MIATLASLVLGSQSMYTYPWSPLPTAIDASVSGPSSVVVNALFSLTVSMKDSDTFRIPNPSGAGYLYPVVGTSNILHLDVFGTNGTIEPGGGTVTQAFERVNTTTEASGPSEVRINVNYRGLTVSGLSYPLERTFSFQVKDPAAPAGEMTPTTVKDTNDPVLARNVTLSLS